LLHNAYKIERIKLTNLDSNSINARDIHRDVDEKDEFNNKIKKKTLNANIINEIVTPSKTSIFDESNMTN